MIIDRRHGSEQDGSVEDSSGLQAQDIIRSLVAQEPGLVEEFRVLSPPPRARVRGVRVRWAETGWLYEASIAGCPSCGVGNPPVGGAPYRYARLWSTEHHFGA